MHSSLALHLSILCLIATTASSFSTCQRHARLAVARTPHASSLRSRHELRVLADDSLSDVDKEEESLLNKEDPSQTALVYLFPAVATLSAFTFYGKISHGFHSIVDGASHNNWYPVDGGQLIGDIILPAINGPVLGTIGLLFATLVSTTVGNLYNRQMGITGAIVQEVDDLRRLGYLLQSLPEPYRREARTELKTFVEAIFEAARKRSVHDSAYRNVTLTPLYTLLNRISHDCETIESVKVSDNIIGEGYELIRRINDQRTTIATLLRPAFPPLHYVNLIALGFCICLVFLIETDRDLVFFLAGFQLRLLFSILIGIFAMMATVIYDLESPFGGSYNVISSTDRELQVLKEYVTRSWDGN